MVMKKNSFEAKLKRLEEIVELLENEDLSLDKSLELFEEGVEISKELNEKLISVKRKIEVVKKDAEGKIKLEELQED